MGNKITISLPIRWPIESSAGFVGEQQDELVGRIACLRDDDDDDKEEEEEELILSLLLMFLFFNASQFFN